MLGQIGINKAQLYPGRLQKEMPSLEAWSLLAFMGKESGSGSSSGFTLWVPAGTYDDGFLVFRGTFGGN